MSTEKRITEIEARATGLSQKQCPLVIRCYEDTDGKLHGVRDEDKKALEMYEAVKDLLGFNGKGPLVIVETIENRRCGEVHREKARERNATNSRGGVL